MAPIKRRALIAAIGGLIMMIALRVWWHFFWPHAIIIGVATAALIYSTFRTGDRLRDQLRR